MANFFNKVFNKKKAEDRGQSSSSSKRNLEAPLLEGRYEAISPTVSPSAEKFLGRDQTPKAKEDKDNKEKEKGNTGLLKGLRGSAIQQLKRAERAPHLSLHLAPSRTDDNKRRTLDAIFGEKYTILDDATLGERRLLPREALPLVKACAQAIITHGALLCVTISFCSLVAERN